MYHAIFYSLGCLITSLTLVSCSLDLYCRDESNQKVDWFLNYKIPKLEKGFPGTYLSTGEAHTYMTSSDNSGWTLSSNSIASTSSMLGLTLQHLFSVKKNASYLFYNDDPPSGFNGTTSGHLKGVVAFDGTSGFWIIHSIPKFSAIDKYEYPKNALPNGQSIFCITFPIKALNDICKQLLFSHPKIYKYGITKEVFALLDNKAKTIFSQNPAFVHSPPFQSIVILKSLGNNVFYSFAKDNQLKQDLYSQIVAPILKSSLSTETWRKGRGTYLPPSCDSNYFVLDIKSINMQVSNLNIFFKSTEDHSKWAISSNSSKKWICVGDINRMASQEKRGGGTVCFQSRAVWNAYSSIINETDDCPIY